MLGRDVTKAVLAAGHEALPYARAELDIGDRLALQRELAQVRPDVVINCAAYTNVDGAERDAAGAERVNRDGPGYLAAVARAVGAWTIHVSTDYVFDGAKRTPYLESDATGPRSVYGETKLAGERLLALAAPETHTIVRTAWLFGAGGPCFPATMLRLAASGKPLRVVDDQVGSPTYTGDLARALVEIATAPAGSRPLGILHVTAAGQCSWFELARETLARAGLTTPVQPCTTAEFPRPAARPAYSVLRSERGAPTLPDWHGGLDAYLVARGEAVDGAAEVGGTAGAAPAGAARASEEAKG